MRSLGNDMLLIFFKRNLKHFSPTLLVLLISLYGQSQTKINANSYLIFAISFESTYSTVSEEIGGNMNLGYRKGRSTVSAQISKYNISHHIPIDYLSNYGLPIPETVNAYSINYNYDLGQLDQFEIQLLSGFSCNNFFSGEYDYYQIRRLGKKIKYWNIGLNLGIGIIYKNLFPFEVTGYLYGTKSRNIDFGPERFRAQFGIRYNLRTS